MTSHRNIDWERYEMQEGLKDLPENEKSKYIVRDKEQLAHLTQEEKEERIFLISQMSRIDSAHRRYNLDDISNWVKKTIELDRIKAETKDWYNKRNGRLTPRPIYQSTNSTLAESIAKSLKTMEEVALRRTYKIDDMVWYEDKMWVILNLNIEDHETTILSKDGEEKTVSILEILPVKEGE